MSGYVLMLFPALVVGGIAVLLISDWLHKRQPMRGFQQCCTAPYQYQESRESVHTVGALLADHSFGSPLDLRAFCSGYWLR
jgi:hypothetical protein